MNSLLQKSIYSFLIFLLTIHLDTLSAKGIEYNKYLNLAQKDKERLIKKYVKKPKNGFYNVAISNYDVYCDISAAKTLQMTIMMDSFYNRFSSIFTGKFKLSSRPKLYILKNNQAYAKAINNYTKGVIDAGWSIGMYITYGNSKSALFANQEKGDKDVQRILFHEGTHQLLHYYTGSRQIPTWFNEGMATNFETWQIERSVQNNISNNLYETSRRHSIANSYPNNGYVPFNTLFNISSSQWSQSPNPTNNYASAWVSINAMLSNQKGKSFFNTMVSGLKAGKKSTSIMSSKTRANFNEFLKKHITSTVIPYQQYALKIENAFKEGKRQQATELVSNYYSKHPESPYAQYYLHANSIMEGKKVKESLS
ncbi:MAG: hypothetical protein HQL32_13635 [Planctomycetes bacterium]|nr:hypothetical protein [Planctomycetota bacterium]